jgi:WD40 repeat protein
MAKNPFVERMNKLVEDSTDAKRIEHFQSVAELQERNKKRVNRLIEEDNQRLEQIEKSEEILLSDALEAVNEITPEMMTKDGSISFVSEAFAFIDGKKSLSTIRDIRENFTYGDRNTLVHYSTVSDRVVEIKNQKTFETFSYTPQGVMKTGLNHHMPIYSRNGLESITRSGLSKFTGAGGAKIKELFTGGYTISPNGQILIAQAGKTLYFGSLRTQNMYNSIEIGEIYHTMAFSPDGKFIALAAGNMITILDAWSPSNTLVRAKMKGNIENIIFHPTLPILISASGFVFSTIKYNENKVTDHKIEYRAKHISFSPDGRLLAVAGDQENLKVYEFENLGKYRTIYTVPLKSGLISIEFNPLGIDGLDGFLGMLEKVQGYISQSGLRLTSKDLTNFTLSWDRKVNI